MQPQAIGRSNIWIRSRPAGQESPEICRQKQPKVQKVRGKICVGELLSSVAARRFAQDRMIGASVRPHSVVACRHVGGRPASSAPHVRESAMTTMSVRSASNSISFSDVAAESCMAMACETRRARALRASRESRQRAAAGMSAVSCVQYSTAGRRGRKTGRAGFTYEARPRETSISCWCISGCATGGGLRSRRLWRCRVAGPGRFPGPSPIAGLLCSNQSPDPPSSFAEQSTSGPPRVLDSRDQS